MKKIGVKKISWINFREEAVLYVNESSYCLRDMDSIFQNITMRGIEVNALEKLELRLKDVKICSWYS
jgi:hypothetical protein